MPSYSVEFKGPGGFVSGGVGGPFSSPEQALETFIKDLVKGSDTTPGEWLVEVYQLDHNDRRIMNLPSAAKRVWVGK